ncbi:MAG: AhpC/TSA family protein [Saprospirales bacterium]|nr:MAG: AhpC/TSA family protein [Saprospirales bacterium]
MNYRTIPVSTLKKMTTNKGDDLYYIAGQKPTLVVFLRNFGCMFCREAMEDISKVKTEILEKGVEIVLVHMSEQETAEKFLKKFKIDDLSHISDPSTEFYQAFGIMKGTFNQLFGLHNWMRGFDAAFVKGHGVSVPIGDGFQMPGIFLISGNTIEKSYVHKSISDRPNYLDLADLSLKESPAGE